MEYITKSGLCVDIDKDRFNNMELLDALSDLEDGNILAISKVCKLLLSKEDHKKLYDHCRNEKGCVDTELVSKEIVDIFQSGKEEKN